MGNSACTPYAASGGSTIRVINGDGVMEEYVQSVRAGELVVENPGRFVCDSKYLNVGCRIPGLSAGEELERRRLYFLLPMDLLFSVLTEEEMAALACMASAAVKKRRVVSTSIRRRRRRRRIVPVLLSDFCLLPPEAKPVNEPAATGRSSKRMSKQWSWKPALDTIEELKHGSNETGLATNPIYA